MDELSLRIKQLRKHLGKSQVEFAKDLGVHEQSVSKWERGLVKPENTLLGEMAGKYSINMNWLMTGQGNMLASSVDSQFLDSPLVQELIKEFKRLPESEQWRFIGDLKSKVAEVVRQKEKKV